jgi:hypothetical protein
MGWRKTCAMDERMRFVIAAANPRVHSLDTSNTNPQRTENCVNHVVGQIRCLCSRLLTI